MDLIRLNVLPPPRPSATGQSSPGGLRHDLAQLVITSAATRITKCLHASPWEVFLCPQHAPRIAIHYHQRKAKNT